MNEGPLRQWLRDRGGLFTQQSPQDMGKEELMSRLTALMSEYAETLSRQNEVTCDILAKELAKYLNLTGDEYERLRDTCIRRLRR